MQFVNVTNEHIVTIDRFAIIIQQIPRACHPFQIPTTVTADCSESSKLQKKTKKDGVMEEFKYSSPAIAMPSYIWLILCEGPAATGKKSSINSSKTCSQEDVPLNSK